MTRPHPLTLGPIALVALAVGCSRNTDPAPACPGAADCRAGTGELRAQPLRRGPHGMQATGPMGPGACALGSGALAADVRDGIARALADERRAESAYEELAERTPGFPLGRIARSEMRHALELERLLQAHGHSVPSAAPSVPPPRAEDARAACGIGAASEKQNIALYDELLSRSLPSDVQCVFERLRAASSTHHLPAFERCAGR